MSDRILITGGQGFLGRHVQQELSERHIPFDTLDLAPRSLWTHDITLPLPEAINGHSRVIHLAGLLGTHELFENINQAIDVNIKGALNILRYCADNNIPFTGVTMAHVWVNPYETTKLAAERLAEALSREYGFPANFYTVYNAYGEYQAYGPGHPQKIIPTFARAAWKGEPIPIWGDGSQVVDLVYARDVARLLVDDPGGGKEGGYGDSRTVREVAEDVWAMVNPFSRLRLNHLPMRRGEHEPSRPPVAENPIDPSEPMLQSLRRTVDWYRDVGRYP